MTTAVEAIPAPREAIEEALVVLNDHGFDIGAPWHGDLDDREREQFEAVERAVAAVVQFMTDRARNAPDGGEVEPTLETSAAGMRYLRDLDPAALRHGNFAGIANSVFEKMLAAAPVSIPPTPTASPASGVGVARVSYKYWSAQHGFTARETAQLLKELADIEDMLNEGQGDDDGMQIMPDFDSSMSTLAKVEKCLFLLEKRRDVIESYLAKEDWRDDPSADERWNAGLEFGMQQLCKAIGVDPKTVNWDAATETLDGDVQSVIWNILRTAYGENFPPAQSPEQGEVVREPDAELVRVLTVLTNKLRAEASRGPVSSREIFNLTDPIMDALSKHGGNQ